MPPGALDEPSGTSVRATMKIETFCAPIVTPPTAKVLLGRICEKISSVDMKTLFSLVI